MLLDKIKEDLVLSQKQGKEVEVSVLRMLLSSITNREKDKRLSLAEKYEGHELEEASRLNEDEIRKVVNFEAKKRKDAIEAFEKGGRTEQAEREKKELIVLEGYLPEQLEEEEIERIVKEVIADLGVSGVQNMGVVMKEVIGKTDGLADGKIVSEIVRKNLS